MVAGGAVVGDHGAVASERRLARRGMRLVWEAVKAAVATGADLGDRPPPPEPQARRSARSVPRGERHWQ